MSSFYRLSRSQMVFLLAQFDLDFVQKSLWIRCFSLLIIWNQNPIPRVSARHVPLWHQISSYERKSGMCSVLLIQHLSKQMKSMVEVLKM